jgi:hypothetical protein
MNNEIMEPSISPYEWQKEVQRVKDQLNFKLNTSMTSNATVNEEESY